MNPIANEEDYRRAVDECDAYFDDEPILGSPEGDKFQELIARIVEYEQKICPMPAR